jgi:hypothetical protein
MVFSTNQPSRWDENCHFVPSGRLVGSFEIKTALSVPTERLVKMRQFELHPTVWENPIKVWN